MNEKLAIEILKQASLETTTGACENCPRKDKNKTCIGCLDDAKDILLNHLNNLQSKIDKVNEFLEELKHNQNINLEKWLENRVDMDYVIERLEDILGDDK